LLQLFIDAARAEGNNFLENEMLGSAG